MRIRYEDHLRTVPMFSACKAKQLSSFARLMERVDVKQGDVLVKEGASSREFFLLVNGEAEVTRRSEHLANLGSGQYFGELALLDPAPRSATVTMTTPGEVLVLAQREFFTLLRDSMELQAALLTGLARRVHALDPIAAGA